MSETDNSKLAKLQVKWTIDDSQEGHLNPLAVNFMISQ